MGNSTASAATEAAVVDTFAGMIMDGSLTFAEFERGALSEGHAIMACAMGKARERLDAALCQDGDAAIHATGEHCAEVCVEVDGTWVALQAHCPPRGVRQGGDEGDDGLLRQGGLGPQGRPRERRSLRLIVRARGLLARGRGRDRLRVRSSKRVTRSRSDERRTHTDGPRTRPPEAQQ
ncbi:MAG TPA: hypothetical protein OIL80_09710 [Adlercreutzia equolifaciens]|uniref:hypothetical protein n=1 Tax=Adlercreutzia equolifaciens TaxID=446660 RepID=UPI00242EB6B4|nr:hypothetical protein [Adlercreutzia equolifaciens]HJI12983.1 hypothetical protein [Adlercreutzia equolifaciens]